jgi:hypothetical protein
MPKVSTNMLWIASGDRSYTSGVYKIYACVMGWQVYRWGKRPKRLGQRELMSQAMALAQADAEYIIDESLKVQW